MIRIPIKFTSKSSMTDIYHFCQTETAYSVDAAKRWFTEVINHFHSGEDYPREFMDFRILSPATITSLWFPLGHSPHLRLFQFVKAEYPEVSILVPRFSFVCHKIMLCNETHEMRFLSPIPEEAQTTAERLCTPSSLTWWSRMKE